MKIKGLAIIGGALLLTITSCGNKQWVDIYNEFNYVYVKSKITGEKYYHIKGWQEFSPKLGVSDGKMYAEYVGLQIETYHNNIYYRYERELEYMFTKDYVASLGIAVEE